MEATYLQKGEHIDYTPSVAVDAGEVLVIGDTVAVAPRPIAANTLGAVTIEGCFRMPKAVGSGTAIAAGVKVYWNAAETEVTTTASTHKVAGHTIAAATDDDTTVAVKLARA